MDDKLKPHRPSIVETFEHEMMEEELLQWGADVRKYAVPDSLEDVFRSGIHQTKRSKKSTPFRKSGYAAAIALFIAIILMTASVSPVFAAALQHIPGMSRILSMMGNDPGLKGAMDHDYMQPVGVSDTHGGTQFTVDGLITDEVRVNVFFSVQMSEPMATNNFGRMKVLDGETQQPIKAMYSYNMAPDKEGIYHGFVDIQMSTGEPVPDKLQLSFSPNENEFNWSVAFPVDKLKSTGKEEIIEVHKAILIDGQKLTIERVNIYPLRLTVDVAFDTANSKRIFQMIDMSIVNEKGQELKNKSSFLGETEQTLHFDSSFFDDPKSLTLKVGRVMALDKKKLNVKVDLDTKQILEAPDAQLSLTQVSRRDDGSYELNFLVQGPTIESDHYGYTLSSKVTDAKGTEYKTGAIRAGTYGNTSNVTLEILSDRELVNPISMKLDNYPAWIDEPFEVKLK